MLTVPVINSVDVGYNHMNVSWIPSSDDTAIKYYVEYTLKDPNGITVTIVTTRILAY